MTGVNKTFPPQKQVLKNIWLSFYYGAKIGVLGLNGSGKSTLLKIIAGIDQNYEGKIEFEKQFNPQNLQDPVYKKFEKATDSTEDLKVEPLENPAGLYGVPASEQKKYDDEYKKVIKGTPDNSTPQVDPNMKEINNDINNLIKDIKTAPEKNTMKDAEDKIK